MRLLTDSMDEIKIAGSNFKFSGIRTDHLGASEYTLVTIAIDETGSIDSFEKELKATLITAVKSCKKSPRADNLLVRVIKFSSSLPSGILEIHGFKPLSDIDPDNDYPEFNGSGSTPLYDATFSAVGATNTYAKKLHDDEFPSNGIVFIITDGADNSSSMTPLNIRKEIDKGVKGEFIESNLTILIGINASQYKTRLEDFKNGANIDHYIDAGNATPGSLAKLASFVSQSVSSQSQALGTGGPSQNISAVI